MQETWNTVSSRATIPVFRRILHSNFRPSLYSYEVVT